MVYMPGNIFDMDKTALKKLAKFQKQFPVKFNHAAAGVLNAQAFEGRIKIIEELTDDFTIRSKGFLKSSVRVDKTKGNVPIDNQFSIAGSIHRKGFTGFIEQQLGTESDKPTVTTEAARGGAFSKKVLKGVRMNRAKGFDRAGQFRKKGKGYNHRKRGQAIVAMLVNAKRGSGEPFVIGNRPGPGKLASLTPGVYVDAARYGITKMQNTDSRWKPKRVDWMGGAMRRLERSFNLEKVWDNELSRQLKRR
jgi:hypothetical protein